MMDLGKLKSFLFEVFAEYSVSFGVFPEMEGQIVPASGSVMRLRAGFRNFTTAPAADSEGLITGDILAEVLYEPGANQIADQLTAGLLKKFSPGRGELRNRQFRVLVLSAEYLDTKHEGKYERGGLLIHVSVWENHEV